MLVLSNIRELQFQPTRTQKILNSQLVVAVSGRNAGRLRSVGFFSYPRSMQITWPRSLLLSDFRGQSPCSKGFGVVLSLRSILQN